MHASHPIRIHRRPLEGLHPAEGWTCYQLYVVDTQRVEQRSLELHHVADRDLREVRKVVPDLAEVLGNGRARRGCKRGESPRPDEPGRGGVKR